MRLCDLQLSLEDGELASVIAQVRTELRQRGLLFSPYFWISDEWFCPDGFSGVAVPFFVLNPRLKRLEREMMGFVDGGSRGQILKILRHEVGHALENAYALKLHPHRRRVFGSHREPYPDSYRPRPYSRQFVRHLGWGYAQSHPDEDFAETFAVWLDPASDWKRKYQGSSALKKLECMEILMKEIRGRESFRGQRGRFEPISSKKMTLAEYYRKKRLHFKIPLRRKLVEDLVGAGSSLEGPLVSDYMRRHREGLVGEVSTALGQPKHLVRRVVSDFIRQGSGLRAAVGGSKQLRENSLNWVTEGSLIYLEKGLDRVVL